MTWFFK